MRIFTVLDVVCELRKLRGAAKIPKKTRYVVQGHLGPSNLAPIKWAYNYTTF